MNFNDRQRELIILAILVTSMLAVIVNSTYDHTTVFWILYQIPSFLLLVLMPTVRVAVIVTLSTQIIKVFFTLTSQGFSPEVIMNLSISVISNAIVFSVMAYFVIMLSKKTMIEEECKKKAEKDFRAKELYETHLEDIKKSKKNLIDSVLKEDEKPNPKENKKAGHK